MTRISALGTFFTLRGTRLDQIIKKQQRMAMVSRAQTNQKCIKKALDFFGQLDSIIFYELFLAPAINILALLYLRNLSLAKKKCHGAKWNSPPQAFGGIKL